MLYLFINGANLFEAIQLLRDRNVGDIVENMKSRLS